MADGASGQIDVHVYTGILENIVRLTIELDLVTGKIKLVCYFQFIAINIPF